VREPDVELLACRTRARPEFGREHIADRTEIEALVSNGEPPGVDPGQVEQIGCELRQARHLPTHRDQELRPRLRIDLLAREQLEKPGERMERRA